MRYILRLFVFSLLLLTVELSAQTGTEFWFAAPAVTPDHDGARLRQYFRFAAGNEDATVRIYQPANPAGLDETFTIPANTAYSLETTPDVNNIETKPVDQVVNTGILVESTAPITCYYEVATPNNPDIFALKGANALGVEFYAPLQNIWPNQAFTSPAYAEINIVATEDNTTVVVYPRTAVDVGRPALTSFTITLNRGQTYAIKSASFQGPQKPTGTAIVSDKPIAVTVSDDSVRPTGESCYDLLGDQIVPVDIIGIEYIVNQGSLNAGTPEYAYAVAVQNNTKLSIGGVQVATLFAGETFRYQVTQPSTYITSSKPVYLFHITGFGCEIGAALLPPLNCAGSEQVTFTRSSNEAFFLNLLVRAGAEDAFELNGNTTIIDEDDFNVVPGTGGAWMSAKIQFTTAQIAVNTANLITNSKDVFSLGLINGGASTGCKYGYFSEFQAEIVVDAGLDMMVCTGNDVNLTGVVRGGATTGRWRTLNGSGNFVNENALISVYEPSINDYAIGSLTFVLESTGICFAVYDTMEVTFTPAPTIDAGVDREVCANNAQIALTAIRTIAAGVLWEDRSGVFVPNRTSESVTYTPTAAEITSGEIYIKVSTTGNADCNPVTDSVRVTFTPAPIVNAGTPLFSCANNALVSLAGTVIQNGSPGQGVWSGGAGFVNPSENALTGVYNPTPTEISNGNVTLILSSINNGNCNVVTSNVLVSIAPAPIVNAGVDQFLCRNNATATLNGTFSNALGVTWVGGLGTFSPNRNQANVTYTPSIEELNFGSVALRLRSTGNGLCNAVEDEITLTFTPAPVVDAGPNTTVCANNPNVQLNASFSGSLGAEWSNYTGTFISGNQFTMNSIYRPSAAEIAAGQTVLYLTSTGNNNCVAEVDSIVIMITPSPTVTAGSDLFSCANNPGVNLEGAFTLAGGVQWSGGTGTFVPSSFTPAAQYIPSPSEITAGFVSLTITTTDQGNCLPVTDNALITITPRPVVNANVDQTLCVNNSNIQLDGSVSVATGGTWSAGGGVFTPSATALNAVYQPTPAELSSGVARLILTSSGNGLCNALRDTMFVNFTPAPIVDAGGVVNVCSNNPNVQLNGTVSLATGGAWSNHNGTFNPNRFTLNAVYTPTPAEIAAGTKILYLSSTGNGNCNVVTDSLVINFTPAPTVDAGPNLTSCQNNASVNIEGDFTIASGVQWSGGGGTYVPSIFSKDITYIPSAAEITNGVASLTITSTGNGNCNAVTDNMVITITPRPVVNANVDQTLCVNNSNIQLDGNVSVATGGTWSAGGGVFTPSATALNAVYQPTPAELSAGVARLILTSSGNGQCSAVRDTMFVNFTPSPTVNAGGVVNICSNNPNVQLNGAVTLATGGAWSNHSGTFNPNRFTLNAVYTPTPAEIIAGTKVLYLSSTGNGNCNVVTDSLVINFTPTPTVSAGPNLTSCQNNASVNIEGDFTTSGGVEWSGGGGTYVPSIFSKDITYIPSAVEISNGIAVLTVTSTGNGNCNAVSDNMVLTINPRPTANAGADITVCANNPEAQLNGSVSVATGGIWSGGNGVFTPSPTVLNPRYMPTPAEVNAGFVNLILTTTGNGLCNAVRDTVRITFGPPPIVETGANQTLCANNPNVTLNGFVSGATGGVWSNHNGSFTPNASSLNAVYTPTSDEINSGQLVLYLTSTGNGLCSAVRDSIIITYTPAPTIDAGNPITVCENNSTTQLLATYDVAGGMQWSGGAGVFVPSSQSPTAQYLPTPAEINAGFVSLIATTTNNGNCNAVIDNVTVNISPRPTVNAGANQFVCENNPETQLNGSFSIASGATWSGGNGTFTPAANNITARYTPTQNELNAGFVNLILRTIGNGNCNAVSDTMRITFTDAPVVNAGANQTLCANNPTATLNANIIGATGGVWTNFSGSFNPNASSLNTVYTPSAAEIASGQHVLYLTSTGNGICSAVRDSVILTFTPAPTASAGSPVTVCANNPTATLSGDFTVAGGVQWSGGGTFIPSIFNRDVQYTPSAAEINTGQATLTMTTTDNGNCTAVASNVTITINPIPTINAGADFNVCANNALISLSATGLQRASGVQWSGGSGTFSPSATNANSNYTPTASEINAGSLALYVTTTGNGLCAAVRDTVVVTFTPAPTVDAGIDRTVCGNNPQVTLNGAVTVASGAVWSNHTGTFVPDRFSLNTVYTPSASEINAGQAKLYLTSTGNGLCSAVRDSIIITITPAPTVNAGPNLTSCANNPAVNLLGEFSNAGSVQWSGASGSFVPSINDRNAQYIPSTAEINAGQVTLTLTTLNVGNCIAVSDQMTVFINQAPTVNAGIDKVVCANNSDVQLNGQVTLAAGGVWSGGLGSFTPANNNLNTVYRPTPAEIASGQMMLTLTSTGNGACNAVADQVNIVFTSAPVVSAGVNRTACKNNPQITLDGSFSGAGGATWIGGSGVFTPSRNDLQATYMPTATELLNGSVVLTLSTTGNGLCNAVSSNVTLNYTDAPSVSAGVDQFICIDQKNVQLNGVVGGPTTTGRWTTSGTGFFVPSDIVLNATYVASVQDSVAGGATLTLTSTNNSTCTAVSDQMQIVYTTPGVAKAGDDQTICANNATVVLNGVIEGGALSGFWSTSGNGTFVPNNTALNAQYIPSLQDTANGQVVLTLRANSCNLSEDQVVITINPSPQVNAGSDISQCVDNLDIQLQGQVFGATTTGVWSILQGSGSFLPNATTKNAIYRASLQDSLARNITLVLTSTNNGLCNLIRDTVNITLQQGGIANAGADVTVCANNADVLLNGGVFAGATTGMWSSNGTGTFSPSNTVLNPVYIPSNIDKTNGLVSLRLTTNSCDAANDEMIVTITPAPSLEIGDDQTICANNANVLLTPSLTVATGITWSSNGSGTFVSGTGNQTTYTPSAGETNTKIYAITTGNGLCSAVRDSMQITITPAPLVNAGADIIICAGTRRVPLQGLISGGASSGTWTTSGTGGFDPGNTLLETDYLISNSDSINRGVNLFLTSTDHGSCLPVRDTLRITITETATVSAGDDITVCANNANIQLNGSYQGGATAATWTTTGDGSFVPNNQTLNAVYLPGQNDVDLGQTIKLSLLTNSCDAAKDDLNLVITPAPFVNGGNDRIVCVNNLNINLDGIVAGASSTGQWFTTGTGQFIPNATTLNATYRASSQDSLNGNVSLILRATNISNCLATVDTVNVRITTGGLANAGPNVNVCSNNAAVQLNGSFSGGASAGVWTSTGSGSFTPNAATMNAVYTPSEQDALSGTIVLTLTVNSCDNAFANKVINITPGPTVNAGDDRVVCANNPNVELNGAHTVSSGAIWITTGSGTFSPGMNVLNATYRPSVQDIQQGQVKLYLSTTGNGQCISVTDSMSISFTPAPIVDAGRDQGICFGTAFTNLEGLVSGANTTGRWRTLGSGFFLPNDTVLTARYHFSAADSANGFVDLVLVSTNQGNCFTEDDTLTITFGDKAFVNAGNDIFLCPEITTTSLNGTIGGGASDGNWSTLGSGTFTPNTFALNATYTMSADDIVAGSVNLVLTSIESGGCKASTDTLTIALRDQPFVNAGNDIVICPATNSVDLSASYESVNSIRWSSLGGGEFQPSTTSDRPLYILSSIDKTMGSALIFLRSENTQGCADAFDTLRVSIGNPLTVGFASTNICFEQDMMFTDTTKVSFGNIFSRRWYFGDGAVDQGEEVTHLYKTANEFSVKLVVETEQGCKDSLTKIVEVYPLPQADFEARSRFNFLKENPVEFIDLSQRAVAWQWIFGRGLDTADVQFPSYNFLDENTYDVRLVVYSDKACSDTLTKEIEINSRQILPPVLPNAFSPNGDGKNDVFYVRGGPFKTIDFRVYNQWGEQIFDTTDPDEGWDGSYKGKPQPVGAYTYTVYAITIDDREYKKSGEITILR